MKKQLIALGLGMSMIATALAGCGGDSSGGSSDGSQTSGGSGSAQSSDGGAGSGNCIGYKR